MWDLLLEECTKHASQDDLKPQLKRNPCTKLDHAVIAATMRQWDAYSQRPLLTFLTTQTVTH